MQQQTRRPVPLRHIVFDIGGVLLHWQPQEIARTFTSDPELQQRLLDGVFHSTHWKKMDLGAITENEARQGFSANTGLNALQTEELMKAIKKALVIKEDTIKIARTLKAEGYRIYCLSNICHEIFDHVSHRYNFFNEFDDIILSASVKLAKPNPAIYRYMLDHFSAQPQETVLIDDMPDNIRSACELGIHGIQFTDAAVCEQEIRQIIG